MPSGWGSSAVSAASRDRVVAPEQRAPQRPRWWHRVIVRVLATVGAVAVALITGIVVKNGTVLLDPFVRDVTGPSVYVTAEERPVDAGLEIFARMLPGGVTPHIRELMTGQAAGLDRELELGVPVGQAKVRLVVQAKDAPLLLTGLWLVTDERRAPLASTLLFMGTQGGGEPIQVRFDADAAEADTARGTAATNLDGRDYFDNENYQLGAGESVEFRPLVSTHTCYCRYHFELELNVSGRSERIPVRRSDGTLFGVSAAVPNPKQTYILPHPAMPPRTVLGTVGSWVQLPPAELCADYGVCDPAAWPPPR